MRRRHMEHPGSTGSCVLHTIIGYWCFPSYAVLSVWCVSLPPLFRLRFRRPPVPKQPERRFMQPWCPAGGGRWVLFAYLFAACPPPLRGRLCLCVGISCPRALSSFLCTQMHTHTPFLTALLQIYNAAARNTPNGTPAGHAVGANRRR